MTLCNVVIGSLFIKVSLWTKFHRVIFFGKVALDICITLIEQCTLSKAIIHNGHSVKSNFRGSDGSEAKLAVTVSEGPSRMGETASALHLFNSLIKEHSKIFCS